MLLQNFLESSASRLPDKTALICGDARLTYREINDRADQLAFFLRAGGIARQDRVAIFLENSVESVISLFGILKADAVFLMLSPKLKSGKLAYILNDCQVKALITHTAKAPVVSAALSQTGFVEQVIWVGPEDRVPPGIRENIEFLPFERALDLQGAWSKGERRAKANVKGKKQEEEQTFLTVDHTPGPSALCPLPHALSPEPYAPCPLPSANIDLDLASIIYTSGSTGNPKGVMLTHLNMVSAATSITTYLENVEDDIIFSCLPLSFDYGLYQVLMTFKFGGALVLEHPLPFPTRSSRKWSRKRPPAFPWCRPCWLSCWG